MGIFWALLSVVIVSVSQLLLRDAMLALPSAATPWALLRHVLALQAGTAPLVVGLAGYLLSMVCWFFALRRLALSRAYALMSLSYVLVWAAAIWLPGIDEPFSWRGLGGVVSLVAGVILIFTPKSKA